MKAIGMFSYFIENEYELDTRITSYNTLYNFIRDASYFFKSV